MSYKFHSVDPVKTFPPEDWAWAGQTLSPCYADPGPLSEEELDSRAACALNAGYDVQIVEFRKPWWTWSHYFLFVKEVM